MSNRAGLRFAVQDAAGNVRTGITATIYKDDGVTPPGQASVLLDQAMYSAASGGTVLSNPLSPDTQGYITVFVEKPCRVIARCLGASYQYEFSTDPTITYTGKGPNPWIDVTTQGVSSGASDNHGALQTLFSSMPDGTHLFIPAGRSISPMSRRSVVRTKSSCSSRPARFSNSQRPGRRA